MSWCAELLLTDCELLCCPVTSQCSARVCDESLVHVVDTVDIKAGCYCENSVCMVCK